MKRLQHPSSFLSALLVGLLCAVFITLSIFRSEEQMRSDHFTYSKYRQAGDTAGAIRIIDAMLKRDKRNPILYADKAFAMLAADTCAEDAVACLEGLPLRTHVPELIRRALSLFNEASRLSPADPVFLHNMGWLSFAAGDTAQAIRYLHRAIALSPFDPVCLVSFRPCLFSQLRTIDRTYSRQCESRRLLHSCLVCKSFLVGYSFFRLAAHASPATKRPHTDRCGPVCGKRTGTRTGEWYYPIPIGQTAICTGEYHRGTEPFAKRHPHITESQSFMDVAGTDQRTGNRSGSGGRML